MPRPPLKKTENHEIVGRDLYLYIREVRSRKTGRKYRYLVIEEYIGNGNRKTILSIPVEKAIENLLWCGGWDLNPRRPTPSGPKPDALRPCSAIPHRGFKQNGGDPLTPSAEKLNAFYNYCKNHASEQVCKQYLRYLAKPLDQNNRWSITAWKKYYRWLCEEKNIEQACILFKKIKSKKSRPDLYVPGLEEIRETLEKAEEPYRKIYLYLLWSGLRLSEVVYVVRNIDWLRVVQRNGYVRVELNLVRGSKKAFWGYFLEVPEKIMVTSRDVSEYARRNGLLAPKYIRKFVATKLVELGVKGEIVDYIQGRTPSNILTKHYLDLLVIADTHYETYAEWLKNNGFY